MTQQEFNIKLADLRIRLLPLARRFNHISGTAMQDEDIVQETLMTLWDLYRKGYCIQNPEPLAVKILKTRCVAAYRKNRLEVKPIDGVEQEGGPQATSSTDRQDAALMTAMLLNSLTKTQQELITMRGELGLSLDEIAQATGKPKTSVKSTISSARRTMLDLIRKMDYDK